MAANSLVMNLSLKLLSLFAPRDATTRTLPSNLFLFSFLIYKLHLV